MSQHRYNIKCRKSQSQIFCGDIRIITEKHALSISKLSLWNRNLQSCENSTLLLFSRNIHLNQEGRQLNLDYNAFHTCLILPGWENEVIFLFCFPCPDHSQNQTCVSCLFFRKCIKTNTMTQTISGSGHLPICHPVFCFGESYLRTMCLRDKGLLLLREACSQDPACRLALGSGFSGQTEERRGVALVANSDVISCSDFSLLLPKSLHCGDSVFCY